MTSPRVGRCCGNHSLLVLAALLAGAGSSLNAQDTTRATAADTTPIRRDSAPVPGAPGATAGQVTPPSGQAGVPPDSLAPDSLRPDTAAAGSGPPGASAPSAAAPPIPPPPVDSALAVACRESSGEPPDLLTVTFQATTMPAEREAVAREVGGKLLGESEHQAPGAWYLQVPGSGRNPLVADRLIRLHPVLEVGATRCPS